MFCPKCGSQIPDGSAFCTICGASATQTSSYSGGYSAYSGGNGTANVPDYLVWNILATLFCCLPLGIVGLIYSSKVNGAKARGDYAAAEAASATAKTWLIVNAVLGGLGIGAYLALAVLGTIGASV